MLLLPQGFCHCCMIADPHHTRQQRDSFGSNLRTGMSYVCTRAPLRGRLTPPATLAQGKEECNKKHVKGAERKRPMIWCEQQFNNAKSCLCRASRHVVLSCAVCFVTGVTF